MKPEKMIPVITYMLYAMITFCYIIISFSTNPIVKIVMNKGFSFLFPTFVFVSFWYIQLKRKRESLSLPKFYLYIFLNIILPYSICIIPYMIYDSNNKIIETIIFANNMPQFLYVKTMIELLLIYPAVEYWVKKNTNFIILILIIVSIMFEMFGLSAYVFTNVFEYIAFEAIGISFIEQEYLANKFLRKNKNRILYSYVITTILMCFSMMVKEEYSFINPAITILYVLSTMFVICYIAYKCKAKYDEFKSLGRGAILDFFTHNPLIVFSSFVMLHPLILKIVYNAFKSLKLNQDIVNLIIAVATFAYVMIYLKTKRMYYLKNKKEVYAIKERW